MSESEILQEILKNLKKLNERVENLEDTKNLSSSPLILTSSRRILDPVEQRQTKVEQLRESPEMERCVDLLIQYYRTLKTDGRL